MEELLEDMVDLKVIRDRVKEPAEDYKAYSRKRKSRLQLWTFKSSEKKPPVGASAVPTKYNKSYHRLAGTGQMI